MTDEIIIWRAGESVVTPDRVRTRLMTVALEDIDLVEVRRPLLVGALLFSAGVFALALRFADVLHRAEFVQLVGLGLGAVAAALIIARLKLHSYSIDGIAMSLTIWRARAMRRAIERVLAERHPPSRLDRRRHPEHEH